jgi:hypothetical protein
MTDGRARAEEMLHWSIWAVQAFIRRSFTIEQRLVQMQQSFRQLKHFRAMAALGHGQSRRRLFEALVKLSPTF